jgi:phage shock protein B
MSDSMSITDTISLALIMVPLPVLIIGVVVVLVRRQSASHAMSLQDRQQMQGLVDTARRMEQRVGYLENVLDNEAPGWRSRSEAR